MGSWPLIAWGQAPGRERGFSLLELMVVLALLTLVIGLVMPGLIGSYQREQQRAELREFMAVLRTARSEAVTRRQRVRLAVDLGSGVYRVEGTAVQGTLRGLSLEHPSLVWDDLERRRGFIIFYPDGSSSGGRLAVVDSRGASYLVEVDTITGKVSLKMGGR